MKAVKVRVSDVFAEVLVDVAELLATNLARIRFFSDVDAFMPRQFPQLTEAPATFFTFKGLLPPSECTCGQSIWRNW